MVKTSLSSSHYHDTEMNLVSHPMRCLLSSHFSTKSARKSAGIQWDARAVRISKTIIWLLQNEFLKRPDGYVPVKEVVSSLVSIVKILMLTGRQLTHPLLRSVDYFSLENIVRSPGQRFHLLYEPQVGRGSILSWDYWWIRSADRAQAQVVCIQHCITDVHTHVSAG